MTGAGHAECVGCARDITHEQRFHQQREPMSGEMVGPLCHDCMRLRSAFARTDLAKLMPRRFTSEPPPPPANPNEQAGPDWTGVNRAYASIKEAIGAFPGDEEADAAFAELLVKNAEVMERRPLDRRGQGTVTRSPWDDDSFPPMGDGYSRVVPVTTRAEEAEAEAFRMLEAERVAHVETRDVLRALVDGEPCDHYGSIRCTTHNARLPCPMADARAHLATYDDGPGERVNVTDLLTSLARAARSLQDSENDCAFPEGVVTCVLACGGEWIEGEDEDHEPHCALAAAEKFLGGPVRDRDDDSEEESDDEDPDA